MRLGRINKTSLHTTQGTTDSFLFLNERQDCFFSVTIIVSKPLAGVYYCNHDNEAPLTLIKYLFKPKL